LRQFADAGTEAEREAHGITEIGEIRTCNFAGKCYLICIAGDRYIKHFADITPYRACSWLPPSPAKELASGDRGQVLQGVVVCGGKGDK
jgi:hypothetical protein